MSGQSIDDQWFSPSAAGTRKSDDITRTGSDHGRKVRGSSRGEEIRHIVIELEDSEVGISNRRQSGKTIFRHGALARAQAKKRV